MSGKVERKKGTGWLLLVWGALLLFVATIAGYELLLAGPEGTPVATEVDVRAEPVQVAVNGAAPLALPDAGPAWRLHPQARYRIAARVLGRRDYYLDRQAGVIPVDLALGWGEVGDPAVDEEIRWEQQGRWYYYRWSEESALPGAYLQRHSANVHIIPASDNVHRAVKGLQDDDRVLLEGLLVDVAWLDGEQERWLKTSLTRADSGAGGCEILLVERLVVDGMAYE